jgi:hypothetical protein
MIISGLSFSKFILTAQNQPNLNETQGIFVLTYHRFREIAETSLYSHQ